MLYSIKKQHFFLFIIAAVFSACQTSKVDQRDVGERSYILFGNAKSGLYDVGFKVKKLYDHSRTFYPEFNSRGIPQRYGSDRPIRLSIWYPARITANDRQFPFTHYIEERYRKLPLPPSSQDSDEDLLKAYKQQTPLYESVPSANFIKLKELTSFAYANPQMLEGQFPLLIVPDGLVISPLCEYLASFGYVIVSVPILGEKLIHTHSELDYLATMRDLEFALGFMNKFPNVLANKAGIIAFGGGGLYAFPMVLQNPTIRAFVSFESAIFMPKYAQTMNSLPGFDMAKLNAGLLHFVRKNTLPDEDWALSDSAKYAERVRVVLNTEELHHHDLAAYGIISARLFKNRKKLIEPVGTSQEIQFSFTRNFLDAKLRNDLKSISVLERIYTYKEKFYEIEVKKSQPRELDVNEFLAIILLEGMERAKEVFTDLKNLSPQNALLKEEALSQISYALHKERNLKVRIEFLEFVAREFPGSYEAKMNLGEAFEMLHKFDLAKRAYKDALEIIESNESLPWEQRKKASDNVQAAIKKLAIQPEP